MYRFSIVIVSSGNRKEKLKRCLEAVFNQNYSPESYEVTVVDSGSTPQTVEFLKGEEKKRFNFRYIFPGEGNVGPARARNLGIAHSKGEVVAFTDDDCLPPPDWLARLDRGYRNYPEVAGVGGMTLPPQNLVEINFFAAFEDFIYRRLEREKGEYLSTKRDEHPAYSGNISYKREILKRVGGFDESFSPFAYGEDGDLKERVLARGYKLLYIPVTVIHLADYNFPSFWEKEKRRGAGILRFIKDHCLRRQSRGEVFLRILFTPGVLLLFMVKNLRQPAMGIMETLAFLGRQMGKLRYYKDL